MQTLTPPQATEIEIDVLCLLIGKPSLLTEVEDALTPECFYDTTHFGIFSCIYDLHMKGEFTGFPSLIRELHLKGFSKDHSKLAATIRGGYASELDFHGNVNLLSDLWIKRQLLTGSLQMQTAIERQEPLEVITAQANTMADVAIGQTRQIKGIHFSDSVDELAALLDQPKKGGLSGVNTGIGKVNGFTDGWQSSDVVVIGARPGMGKCLGKGTKVVMFDGTFKRVEDVLPGDLLMGSDSTYRKVLSIARGREQMYWVRQNRAIDYRVNESHILSLKRSRNDGKNKQGDVLNISVKDYLLRSAKFKTNYKGYKTGVEFGEKKLPIDPYFLGLWLGDGSSFQAEITTSDSVVVDYLEELADFNGIGLRETHQKNNKSNRYHLTRGQGGDQARDRNPIFDKLRRLDLFANKHIPLEYLTGSREQRLLLLAGLIDSDGHYSDQYHCYEITQKRENLSIEIKRLCDSLGFRTSIKKRDATIRKIGYKCEVTRVRISGDLDSVPCKVSHKLARLRKAKTDWRSTGIAIELDKVDDYYGFELDGDGLFLLEDYTVTHNTAVALHHTYHAALSGVPVAFVSLEMPKWGLTARIVSNLTSIEYGSIMKRDLVAAQKETVLKKANEISKYPIYYYDYKNSWDINDIALTMRSWKRKYGIGLIFIDYIQLVRDKTIKNASDETAIVNSVSRKTKQLQSQLDIPIIELAQLSREVEKKGNRRPGLSDLKQSGQLEQDASTVIFLYRDDYYRRKEDEANKAEHIPNNEIEYIFEKNRNGQNGSITLGCKIQYNQVYDLDESRYNGGFDNNYARNEVFSRAGLQAAF